MSRLRAILALALVATILPASLHAWPWHSQPSHHALAGAWRLAGTLSGPGRTHEFQWRLVDGRWYHTGILHGEGGREFHIAEVWERAR